MGRRIPTRNPYGIPAPHMSEGGWGNGVGQEPPPREPGDNHGWGNSITQPQQPQPPFPPPPIFPVPNNVGNSGPYGHFPPENYAPWFDGGLPDLDGNKPIDPSRLPAGWDNPLVPGRNPGDLPTISQSPAGQQPVGPQGPQRPRGMSAGFERGLQVGGDLWEQNSVDRGYYKPAMENIMGKLEDNMRGLNSAQMETARGQASNRIGGEYQTGMRNMLANQARSGIRGGAAQKGMMDLAERRAGTTADFEANLMLKNQDIMSRAVQDYQKAVTGERFGQLSSMYNMGGLYGGWENAQDSQDIIGRYLGYNNNAVPGWAGAPTQGGIVTQQGVPIFDGSGGSAGLPAPVPVLPSPAPAPAPPPNAGMAGPSFGDDINLPPR